jgi:hypothetical protein
MTSAISDGWAARPSGWPAATSSGTPANWTPRLRATNAVSIAPGPTALTRTPRGANSTASWRVSWMTAPFVVQ